MNPGKKTFVILTAGFAASETDSTCIPMQQCFVRALKGIYPELHIIILAFQYPYFKEKYTWFGSTVIPFSGMNKGGFSKLLLRRKLYVTLKEIHHEYQITGLLSFWYGECALVGKRFADKYKLAHRCWIWGQDARKGNKYVGQTGLEPFELIAFSEFLQDEFEKNYNTRPLHVVAPGMDIKYYTALPALRDIDILAAGSLIPLKQYDVFIEIVAAIKKQLPGIKAILMGNGPEKDRLQYLIAKHGLEDTITLTGELPHDEVLGMMQRTKTFLHPSSYEGFSGVCLEALWAGAHVISFCRAMKEEIDHWHIVHDREEMKQKTLGLLQDPGIKYESVTVFKVEDTARKMMEVFGVHSR